MKLKSYFFRDLVLLFILFSFSSSLMAQNKDKELENSGLINLATLIPNLEVKLIYATPYNFMGRVLYKDLSKAYLIKDAADKLFEAYKLLRAERPDLHLVVYDAARPISIQEDLWALVEGTDMEDFVANPYKGNGLHNYGVAIDVTLADCTGLPLAMGSGYDYFGDESRIDIEEKLLADGKISKKELENRLLLRKIMTKAGFTTYSSEWWHFNAYNSDYAKQNCAIIE